MGSLEDLRLVDGPVVWFSWAAAAAGLAYLLWHGVIRHSVVRNSALPNSVSRHSAARSAAVVAAVAVLAAALVAAVHWFLIYAVAVFADELPWEPLAWSFPAVAALLLWLLCLAGLHGSGRIRRRLRRPAAATAAFLAVLTLSAVQINSYFGLNHTVSDLTGTAVARIQPLEVALTRAAGGPAAIDLARWRAPAHLASGVVRKASIPGTVSGFSSREAYVYLPPAYQSSPRPALPVLVLFSGQPGGPADWLTGGALRNRLDRFAAGHAGGAPVVVVVDPNGSQSANTLCMDSRIAQADTFLARDVPDWIKTTLAVDPDHRQWAAGGFSFGGTCAMQMVTRHPGLYSAALSFSSEREPALAKERAKTVEAAFGGDTGAFDRQPPLHHMAERRFDGHGVYLAVGEDDAEFAGYMDEIAAAARKAGFAVETRRIADTGHSWATAATGLPGGLDFLARRWGITP